MWPYSRSRAVFFVKLYSRFAHIVAASSSNIEIVVVSMVAALTFFITYSVFSASDLTNIIFVAVITGHYVVENVFSFKYVESGFAIKGMLSETFGIRFSS